MAKPHMPSCNFTPLGIPHKVLPTRCNMSGTTHEKMQKFYISRHCTLFLCNSCSMCGHNMQDSKLKKFTYVLNNALRSRPPTWDSWWHTSSERCTEMVKDEILSYRSMEIKDECICRGCSAIASSQGMGQTWAWAVCLYVDFLYVSYLKNIQ